MKDIRRCLKHVYYLGKARRKGVDFLWVGWWGGWLVARGTKRQIRSEGGRTRAELAQQVAVLGFCAVGVRGYTGDITNKGFSIWGEGVIV